MAVQNEKATGAIAREIGASVPCKLLAPPTFRRRRAAG